MSMQEDGTVQHPTRRSLQSIGLERGTSRIPHAAAQAVRSGRVNDIYEIGPRITHIDRAIIRHYFQERGITLPQERRRRFRHPTLPAQLSPRVSQNALPDELERKLSQIPDDCERVIVGRDVLLVESDTRTVVDILHQAGAPGV